jgi:hypothetical protein
VNDKVILRLMTGRIKLIRCFCLCVLILITSCAPTKKLLLYPTDYPLTDDISYSVSSDLQMKIPEGWFTAEDNECKCIDLWLIKDGFSASLNLMPVKYDSLLLKNVAVDEFQILFNYSKELKKAELKDKFIQMKEDDFFEINGVNFAAYEYQGDEGLPIRVVVFKYKNRYFEFSAVPAQKIGKAAIDPNELFKVQQAVLASIR